MDGWIKMALGVEVGLSPGHIVLDGDPAAPPQKKGVQHTIFGLFLLWLNGWMHQDGTWHGGEPRSRPHCAKWGSSYPPQKGAEPPIFGPCLLWPRSSISAATELLYETVNVSMQFGALDGYFVVNVKRWICVHMHFRCFNFNNVV